MVSILFWIEGRKGKWVMGKEKVDCWGSVKGFVNENVWLILSSLRMKTSSSLFQVVLYARKIVINYLLDVMF